MAPVNIIDTSSEGYKLVWQERHYLLKLAVVPFLIKLVCYLAMMALGWEHNFFRQGLLMLPSFFADGWLLSHLVRLIYFDQRWPFRPTGDSARDLPILQERALGIMRGTLMFVVIRYLLAGVTALLYMSGATPEASAAEGAMTPAIFLAFIGGALVFIWSFRLVWLFIPAASNVPVRPFLKRLGGFRASWLMLALWLMAYIPLTFVAMLLLSMLGGLLGGAEHNLGLLYVVNLSRVFLDTVVNIIATASIAIALKKYFGGK